MKLKIKAKSFNDLVIQNKNGKFEKMIGIQEKFIKENMFEGKKSVVWIFQDIEYYNSEIERMWFKEFREKAKSMFEKKGFEINGVVIKW